MSILFLELCSVYLTWLRCVFACYFICLSAYCFVKKELFIAGLVMFSLSMMCSMWLLQEEQVPKVKAGPDSEIAKIKCFICLVVEEDTSHC